MKLPLYCYSVRSGELVNICRTASEWDAWYAPRRGHLEGNFIIWSTGYAKHEDLQRARCEAICAASAYQN